MSTIFAKGFDAGTDEEAVKKHFGVVGAIKELYFQSRDSAVITYDEASAASQAVEELSEKPMEGQSRSVLVKLDRKGEGEGKGSGKSKGKRPGQGGSQIPGRTIFVSGFDFDTDDAALQGHFGEVGAIDSLHFQSKWAAVITFCEEASAQKALTLDGTTMSGQDRYVAVRLDDPDRHGGKGKAKGKGKGNGGKGSDRPPLHRSGEEDDGRSIFASGFDFDTDDAAVKKHFGGIGAIETLHFQSSGAAVITFVKASAAQQALAELDGSTMSGQKRYVAVKLNEPDRNGRKGKGSGKAKGKGK